MENQGVSTGTYRPDGKVLIGVLLGATIKTISLEREEKTIEQDMRDREALLVEKKEGKVKERRKVVDMMSKNRA
jgi:hypothetical protein